MQDRFIAQFKRLMTALDMQAWTAVRMIGEAASRQNSADPKTILDFLEKGPELALGAFKGQKLTLRDWDLQLRQPIFSPMDGPLCPFRRSKASCTSSRNSIHSAMIGPNPVQNYNSSLT